MDIDEICDAWALLTSKKAVTTTLRQAKEGVDVTAKPEEPAAAAPAAAMAPLGLSADLAKLIPLFSGVRSASYSQYTNLTINPLA